MSYPIRKARKEWECTICSNVIAKGEKYHILEYPIVRGGSPEYQKPDRFCLRCKPVCICGVETVQTYPDISGTPLCKMCALENMAQLAIANELNSAGNQGCTPEESRHNAIVNAMDNRRVYADQWHVNPDELRTAIGARF